MKVTGIMLVMLLAASTLLRAQPQNSHFDTWDTDGDGYINDTEFGTGIDHEGHFKLYDSNTDGVIDDAEWRTARETSEFLESDFFTSWDTDQDGFLHEDEFVQGTYNTWDANRDGQLEQQEYDDNYVDWSR